MAPSPMYGHQFVNLKIARQLDEKLDDCSKCHSVIEMDWQISEDSVVRPDSMVICYEPDDRLTKKPEIVFEVSSKSTARRDEILKFDLYQSEGVKYYILVYPEIKKAKVYQLIDLVYKKMGDFSDEVYTFEADSCKIDFDFNFIWRK
jgi:Uma2 family endonuclease